MEPIKTDMESSIDLIGSPIQSQEQSKDHNQDQSPDLFQAWMSTL